jgi:hypothetical protein
VGAGLKTARLGPLRVAGAALAGLALGGGAAPAVAVGESGGPRACLAIGDDGERLACYDREVLRLVPPTFSGRLARTTDRFHVDRPTLLRYRSDGAIFVLYLKTAEGEVVQNLHIGGGGEASYLIERPGTYFLDVHGSESWRIWLEPQATANTNQR